jgi:hypothetical protein
MILNGLVISSDVQAMGFYDQVTGALRPSFSVVLTVIDEDEGERYECQFTDGFPLLETLKQRARDGAAPEELEALRDQLRQELPQKMERFPIRVKKVKSKGFIRLSASLQEAAVA